MLVLRPSPSNGAWERLAAAHGTNLRDEQRSLRAELGLPTDRPVVMTGHQAEWWHPGIVAKAIAADVLAHDLQSVPAWVVVDQDDNDAVSLRFPVIGQPQGSPTQTEARLSTNMWRLDGSAAGDSPAAGVPTGRRAALRNVPLPTVPAGIQYATPDVERGLHTIRNAVGENAAADGTLAVQIANSLVSLLTGAEDGEPLLRTKPIVFTASALAKTRAFAELVHAMANDVAKCVEAYNRACARFPQAGSATLQIDTAEDHTRTELPLWRIGVAPGSARQRATVADARAWLETNDKRQEQPWTLVPRALLMTGLLRSLACDLFIHGLGGEQYDPITEAWFADWRGVSLAPTVVASANVRLPLSASGPAPVLPEEIAHAQWARHSARHNPQLLGDNAAAAQKLALVSKINTLKRSHPLPRTAATRTELLGTYRELHRHLDSVREKHADEIREIERSAAEMHKRLEEARILADRTWAFPLYAPAQLIELRDRLHAALRA